VLLLGAATDDSEGVRQGFQAYKRALLAKDGTAAAAAVSANSLKYYDRMRRLALSAPRSEVESLDGTEQLLVLSLRVRAPATLLRSGSPNELIAYAVDGGMISATSVSRTELGSISVVGTRASASLVVDGQPAPGGVFVLHNESGAWKFDLEHAASLARGLFQALAEQRGVSQEALILELLSRVSGRTVGPEVWAPPSPQ
jgi:hypothetical protein